MALKTGIGDCVRPGRMQSPKVSPLSGAVFDLWYFSLLLMHQLKRSSDLHEILSFHLRKIVSLALYFWRKDENIHVQRLKKEKDTLKIIKNHNKHEFFI